MTTSIKLPNPPSVSRHWLVTLPHPKSPTMAPVLAKDPTARMTDEACDQWAASLPWPAGWTCLGTIQASSARARGPISPNDKRTVIVTLVPTTWTAGGASSARARWSLAAGGQTDEQPRARRNRAETREK